MTTASDGWHGLLLADLLRTIHLRSAVNFRPEFAGSWGISLPAIDCAVFHVVARRQCWLEVAGVARPVLLSTGDLVILPHGDAHVMFDAPTRHIVDFFELINRYVPDKDGWIRIGSSGPVTRLVCGGMRFESSSIHPLLAVLPPLLHVRSQNGRAPRWLRATMCHLFDEVGSDRPGGEAVISRLTDIMFIQAVREYVTEGAETADGWLPALRDRQIGRAVALLHAQPQQPWTVELLADRVAISRSTFAAKFTQLVGEPPLHYLTRVRLDGASRRLGNGDKLRAVAASAGYVSVSAFCKAFKRELGMTPGEYRRARDGGRLTDGRRAPVPAPASGRSNLLPTKSIARPGVE